MRTAPEIKLTKEERATLKKLVSSGKSPARMQTRARMLLMAAERSVGSRGGDRRRAGSNREIAQLLEVSERTVSRTRQRFIEGGLDQALQERSRSGRPPRITGEVEARLTMLACSSPPEGRARWTLQLLADKMVELGYIDTISDVGVMKTLKKTSLDPGQSRVGAYPK
jgi:putative transposase